MIIAISFTLVALAIWATLGPPDWRHIQHGLGWPVHLYRWFRRPR